MWSRPPSTRRRQRGFTLIELMIGVVIGLLATLAVTHVLVNSEGQKRTISSGSDAQVNGALALNTLQRALQPAGYGFGATPRVVGCTLSATFSGAAVAGFPTVLAPVTITKGALGAPDTVRVLASGKISYSVPLRVVAPGYAPPGLTIPLSSVRGIVQGDLLIAAQSITAAPSVPCEVFQASATPTTPQVARADSAWNAPGRPSATYGDGGAVINMGSPIDVTYSIVNNALVARSLSIASDASSTPSYPPATELFPNIVQLQAFYGKDTSSPADGSVDAWDAVTPASNAEWGQVVAVRVAIVARSAQYERDEVTTANLRWDVGNAGTVAGSAACGASRCVEIKLDTLPDWRHYRYKLFETVVPLRNMLWNS